MRRLTSDELVAITDRELGTPSLDRGLLLGHIVALTDELAILRSIAHSAREYLSHDGSGIGEAHPWGGDFDLLESWRAREDLREGLTAHASHMAG